MFWVAHDVAVLWTKLPQLRFRVHPIRDIDPLFLFLFFFSFLHLLAFFCLWWQKMLKNQKRQFQPANGLHGPCSQVEIHNRQGLSFNINIFSFCYSLALFPNFPSDQFKMKLLCWVTAETSISIRTETKQGKLLGENI